MTKAYWSYVENLITDSKEKTQSYTFQVSKRFWSIIKHMKTDSSAVQNLHVSDIIVTYPKVVANVLNDPLQSALSNRTPMSREKICDDYLTKN